MWLEAAWGSKNRDSPLLVRVKVADISFSSREWSTSQGGLFFSLNSCAFLEHFIGQSKDKEVRWIKCSLDDWTLGWNWIKDFGTEGQRELISFGVPYFMRHMSNESFNGTSGLFPRGKRALAQKWTPEKRWHKSWGNWIGETQKLLCPIPDFLNMDRLFEIEGPSWVIDQFALWLVSYLIWNWKRERHYPRYFKASSVDKRNWKVTFSSLLRRLVSKKKMIGNFVYAYSNIDKNREKGIRMTVLVICYQINSIQLSFTVFGFKKKVSSPHNRQKLSSLKDRWRFFALRPITLFL